MINPSGSVQVNGITDSELAEILEIKAKNPTLLNFNPQQLQPMSQPPNVWYNGAQFGWTSIEGFKIVQEVITFLIASEEKALAEQKAKAQGR